MNKFEVTSDNILPGNKVKFFGAIQYHQDFCGWECDFQGMEFTVRAVLDNGMISLTAPGYGILDVPDQYGNGAIFIHKSKFEEYTKQKYNDELDARTIIER